MDSTIAGSGNISYIHGHPCPINWYLKII
jgi:hypothetical protein